MLEGRAWRCWRLWSLGESETQALEARVQGLPAHAQELGGAALVVIRLLPHREDRGALVVGLAWSRHRVRDPREEGQEGVGVQQVVGPVQRRHALHDVLELADVAG